MAKNYSGGITISTGFKIDNPNPIADYMVVDSVSGLTALPNQFNGMHVYVSDVGTYYTKKTTGWSLTNDSSIFTSGTTASTDNNVVVFNGTSGKSIKDLLINGSHLTGLTANVQQVLGNVISTGVYFYTGMTVSSTISVDISPVNGWIIYNTYDNSKNPSLSQIIYSGQTNYTITGVSSYDSTYILLSSGSTITQQSTYPTLSERRNNIFLGKINHPNRNTILNINNLVDYDVSPMSALRDMFSSFKLINDGITISSNGNNLTFNLSSGNLYGMGINWVNNQLDPNRIVIPTSTPKSFLYSTQTGGTTSNVTNIDPNSYDLNGIITTIVDNSNKKSTNQRVYLYPTGVINIQYGQKIYDSLPLALAAQQTESFIKSPNVATTALLIGLISVRKGATNLSDPNDAVFVPASIFGESVGGVNGISTTTLQQAYNNSGVPQIVTNSTLDGVEIQIGSASNSDKALKIKNLSGTITASIDGNGNISGNTLTTTGDVTSNNMFSTSLNRSTVEVGIDTKMNTGIPYSERQKFKINVSVSGSTVTASLSFIGVNTSFSYYSNDRKFTVTSSNIDAYTKTGTTAEGVWFYYIQNITSNTNSPFIILSKTPWNIYDSDVFLWNFYINASNNTVTWIGEERHTAGRDIFNHARNHAEGAIYNKGFVFSQYNGLSSATLSTNTDNNFGRAMAQIAGGSFFDEDIKNNITHSDASLTSTVTNPSTDWNLNVTQYLGFNDTNTSTTSGTLTFPTPHTFATGQGIAVMAGNTTTIRGTFTINAGGTGNSFVVTTQTGSNAFANGDIVVVGARIPIYYINTVAGSTYTWRKLTTTDFLGVTTGGSPITPTTIATAVSQYNNASAGGFAVMTSTRYYPVYLMATNTTSEPIIAVLGQGQSTSSNLTTALSENSFQYNNLVGLSGLEIQEIVPFMRLTYQYSSQAAFNTSRIRLVDSTFLNVRTSTTSGSFFGSTAQQTAATTPFTPYDVISGTTVQLGMQDLADVKLNKTGGVLTGDLTGTTFYGSGAGLTNIQPNSHTHSQYLTGVTTDSTMTGDGTISSPLVVNIYSAKRLVQIKISSDSALLTTGNGKFNLVIPQEINGYNVVSGATAITTTGSTTDTIVSLFNVNKNQNILTTNMYINPNKYTSYVSTPQPVINTLYDDVSTGDIIRVDVSNSGTGAKGLTLMLTFQKP